MVADRSWADAVSWLRALDSVASARAVGDLLAWAEADWGSRLVARTSMHDALLTKPGAPYPFSESLTVKWSDSVYEFIFSNGGVVIAADRCSSDSAHDVFDSFAVQLAGGELPDR